LIEYLLVRVYSSNPWQANVWQDQGFEEGGQHDGCTP
jgi:hypothetical protein